MSVLALFIGIFLIVYLFVGLLYVVGLYLPPRAGASARPFVSVIIAARNEENNILRCLTQVMRQTYPADKFEVIVVDDRSTDQTARIISDFAAQFPQVKLLHISDKPENISGKKNALDRGIKESKGEILLFTDADCLVKESWIDGIAAYFTDKVGAVIGFSSVEAVTFFERWQEYDFLSLMSAACGITNIGFPLAASGQNLAYRRKAFDLVGGFERIKERISGDDTLMIQLIRKQTEYQIVFSGDTGTFNTTQPMGTLNELIHQRSRWASNGTIMLQLNPVFFFYLVSVYFLHVLLVAGFILSFQHFSVLLITAFAWTTKGIVDFAVTYSGAQLFHKKFSPLIFLSWFILQTPLILWVGLKGAIGLFRWK